MTTTLSSFWLSAAVLVLLGAWRMLRRRSSLQQIRGPPLRSLLLGHELELENRSDVGEPEFRWMKEYGTTWRIGGCFGTDILMTADPKVMQHIYQKSGYAYRKRTSFNHLAYLSIGPGLIHAQGEVHQRHRKIMNPAFSAARLRSFLPLFQRIANKLFEKWKAQLANSEESEAEILVNGWLSRATLDIIGEAAFNYDYDALDGGQDNLLAKAYGNLSKDIAYRVSPAGLLFRSSWDYTPELILRLFKYIPIDPFARMLNVQRVFMEHGHRMLCGSQTELTVAPGQDNKDIMHILIKANSSADPKTRLSDQELMAQMETMTFAGHETTSSTLTFLLYELARNPDYQDRMRKEIQALRARVIERGSESSDLTMEELDSLVLTMNAIKARSISLSYAKQQLTLYETLRFHSIVPQLPRVAAKDDVLPLAYPIVSTTGETLTEIPIKSGQVVFTSFAAYHRLTEVWGADANTWNPDRFFRPEIGKESNVGVFANLDDTVAAAGHRACVGWKFSVIEMQALVAELVGTFHFALPTQGLNIQRSMGLTMMPIIPGREGEGAMMPLRVSLAQQLE
ncbi:PAH-inducible cytochrome P450 monooxygenase PC-PAH 4 [Earliella scabrosa]|nr:PAH-inducible cytochrome P450 monooxygenase PC-PAH 4 [Earliella scabrosa]